MDSNCEGRQATAEDYEMEHMKKQLLLSMSEDIQATLNWVNESESKSGCSIFKVPQAIAGGIAEACRPCIVSIGPYHHGESQLRMFQGHKWRYLDTMLGRIQWHGIRLENLIDVVAPKEKMIRQCYSESIDNFSVPDLVKMMVLDGCFIIELLRQVGQHVPRDSSWALLSNTYLFASVAQDFLRLENQLPYFVLEDLFQTTNAPEGILSLADLTFRFFGCFLKGPGKVCKSPINLNGVHLLDLFRQSLVTSNQQDNQVDENSSFHTIRSASELHRVGIGFKQREASTFLEIKFDKKRRIIGIPKWPLDDDDLNLILANMVAFEQCCGLVDGHITAYAMFMGCLIRTADDVQLLRDCKVISNHGMSNEDFARFFGDVRKAAPFYVDRSYLASEFATLNESLRCERAYLCWAQLLNAFNDNPWSALSGLAIIVTLAGMIQTVYAVLQYYHPK